MKILFYRYGSVCEPAIIKAFTRKGHQVEEITEEIYRKDISPKEQIKILSDRLFLSRSDFVFSINFYPAISEVCNIFKCPYVGWIVDSPVLELYSDALKNEWNRIFLFDYAMYEEFQTKNSKNIFYLPLASDVAAMQECCMEISESDRQKYQSDIAFVGSLYTEKCEYNRLNDTDVYLRGYLEGVIESQLKVYGYNFVREVISDSIAERFKKAMPGFYNFPEKANKDERAVVADYYIGNKVTEQERLRLLKVLSQEFRTDIYTGSDTSMLPEIHNRGRVDTQKEMPKVFCLSRINLNMTSKAIKTGLPQRIWDILSCKGFVLTNYQSEIPEYFEIGRDLDTYASEEELIVKCRYYLEHEEERREIAERGFRKVQEFHTLEQRLDKMIDCIN